MKRLPVLLLLPLATSCSLLFRPDPATVAAGQDAGSDTARFAFAVVLALALALAACGHAPGPGDTRPDAGRDGAADALEDGDDEDARAADADREGPHDAETDAVPEAGPDADVDPGAWRSALYPRDWAPGFRAPSGELLHDFSYAGYRAGEAPLGALGPTAVIDAVERHGADPTGAGDSATAVQAAIDEAEAAPGGAVVFLRAGFYRLDEPVTIRTSSVVLRGEGSTATRLHLTATRAMAGRAHVTFAGDDASDLELSLAADGRRLSAAVEVADAADLAPGDLVDLGWTITPEFVADHGMTGTWAPFNDTWQAFFRREVVAVDRAGASHRVTLDVPLRADALVRDGASLRRRRGVLRECGLDGLGVANAPAWDTAWSQDQVHAVELRAVRDCWVRDVTSFESPSAPATGPGAGAHLWSGGVLVSGSSRVTVADCSFEQAANRGSGGNGYLFEVRQSGEVLFRDCRGRAGRHNFIQNWGFGTTGCVWLRVASSESRTVLSRDLPVGLPAASEYHHSLATANLVDSSTLDDGWQAVNRGRESSGAGHTATECVFWNVRGGGSLRSFQYATGYVVGSGPDLRVVTSLVEPAAWGTAPLDWFEGLGLAEGLGPASLYEDQLARRLGRPRP